MATVLTPDQGLFWLTMLAVPVLLALGARVGWGDSGDARGFFDQRDRDER